MSEAANPMRSHEAQRLKDDLQGVGDRVGQVKEQIVGLGHDVAGAARSGVAAAKQSISSGVDMAREQGEDAMDSLNDQIRAKPLTSVGIALGVGVLIGMVMCRPRS